MTWQRLILNCVAMAAVTLSSAQFYSPPSKDMNPGSGRIPSTAPSSIRIDQQLNRLIEPDLEFKNQFGEKVTTGEIFSQRPSILLMIFYKCGGVCSLEMENLLKTVRGLKKDDIGDFYNLVVVSIDSSESPTMAKTRFEQYRDSYNRKGTDKGMFFLTGDDKNIQALADQVGFKFYRDPANGQITHPAGLMVVSPQRRLTRYFLSDTFEAKPVLMALQDAEVEKVGARDDRPFFMACINVDPLTGQRSLNIMNLVRTAGVITVLALAVWIVGMSRAGRKDSMTNTGGRL